MFLKHENELFHYEIYLISYKNSKEVNIIIYQMKSTPEKLTYEELLKQKEALQKLLAEAQDQLFEKDLVIKLTKKDVQERRKELKVLSKVIELFTDNEKDESVVFDNLVRLLPSGWSFPEITSAMLDINGVVYSSGESMNDSFTMKQPIAVNNDECGSITIYCQSQGKEFADEIFLPEEYDLLKSLALKTGNYIERINRKRQNLINELKYKQLIETINEIVIEVDADGFLIFISPSVYKTSGFYAEELLGRSLLQYIYEDDLPPLLKSIEGLKQGKDFTLELRFYTKEHEVKHIILSANPTYYEGQLKGFTGTITDITTKKKTEILAREQELIYKSIIDASPDIITITDLEGKIVFTSPKVAEIFGYEDSFIFSGHNLIDYLDPSEKGRANEAIFRMFAGERSGAEEYVAVKKDGSKFYVEVNGEFIKDEDGVVQKMIFVTRDVTKRKEIEQKLVSTEELYRTMVESINDTIYEIKSDGTIVYVSPAIKNILGYEPAELIGENIYEYMYREDIPYVVRTLSELSVKKLPYIEYRYYTKDRQIKWVRTSTSPIFENGVLVGSRGSLSDIHERKLAEASLRESETNIKKIISAAPVGMVVLSEDQTVVLVNDIFTQITGYDQHDISNVSDWWLMAYPDEEYRIHAYEAWNKELGNYFEGRSNFTPVEAKVKCKNGEDRYLEISFVSTGQMQVVTFVDITERKLATQTLAAQKDYTDSIINAFPDLMFIMDSDGTIDEFKTGNYDDLAMPPEAFIHKNVSEVLPPLLAEQFTNVINQVLKGEKASPVQYQLPLNDEMVDFEARFNPFTHNKVIVLVSNISQRIQSEKAIKISEEKLRIIANNTFHWEFWQGPDGKPIYHSPSSEKITGIQVHDLIENYDWVPELMHPDDRASYNEHHLYVKSKRAEGQHYFRIINRKGELKHIYHVCQPVFDENNNYLGIRGSNVDVTQRVVAEKELIESNRKINVLMNNLKGVAYRCNNDKAWTMDFISNGIAELTGYDADDFIKNNVRDFNSVIFEEDRDKVWEEIQKGLSKNQAYAFEYRIITADGTQKWVWERGQGVFENGELIALEGFISDISEKKLAENALRESEEKYRLIAENTSDGIFIINENNVLDYASPAYRKQMGFDPVGELSLNQETIYNIIHPDERDQVFKTIFEAIAAQKESLTFSYRALHHQKQEYQWLEDKVRFTYNDEGKLLFTQGISRDISDRKKAEAAIKLSEEKYRSLIESSDSAIVMLDYDGNYMFLNNIAALPFEMHPDAMVGMNVKQLFPPDQAESVLHDIARVLETNEGFVKEVHVHLAGKETWFRVSVQPVRNESEKVIAVLIYSTNITESKLSQERIKQSEKKYKVLFNDSPDPYLIIRDGKFIECNKAAELLLKADRSEIIGKNPAEISPEFQPDGRKSALLTADLLKKTFEDGSNTFEWVHLRMDGTEVLVQINLTAIEYDGETVLFTTWQDMTEKRAAAEKLRKLSRAVEQSPVSIVITNVNGEIEYANPAACETTGYSQKELIGKNPRVLKSGETTHDEYSKLWNSISVGKEWKGVFHNKKKNGELYWESSTIAPILDADGNITHYVALKEDITERREMQLALQESQERFAQIAEQSQTVTWEVDRNGLYIYVSQVAEKIWGYTPSELVGKMHFYDLHPAELREAYKKAASDLLTNMVTLRDFENPIQRKDGSIIWVSTNGIPVTNLLNEFVGYRGADINITERKLAEEELRKFRTISDQANYGTAIANLDGTLAYVNEAFAAMHGWEISELIGKSLAVLHTPEQMESVAPLLGLIQTQVGFSAEEVWRVKKDGTVFPSLMNTKLIFGQNNQPQFMAASATDITELKRTEESLRRSEETLNHAQEIAKMGSWEYDLFTDSVTWSKNYYKLIGLDPAEPPLALNQIRRMVHPDDRTVFESKLSRMQDSQIPESIYFRLMMPDESIKWIQANMVPFFEDGRLVRVSGVSIDITEKKEAEERIREQNMRLNAIMDAMPDMIFVSDKDGNYLEYFKSKINALQNNYEHLVGANLRESFDEITVQLHLEKIKECLETRDIITYEYPKTENEITKYFEGRIVAMDENKVLRFVREITEKKFQENEIKKLTLAIEQSPVAIVITDLKAIIQYVSPAFYNTTGYTAKEAIGLNANVLKSGKTPEAVYKDLWNTINQGKAWEGEWINKKKNGEFYWESISITPIFDENGLVSSYLAIKQDISERKKAENEILELNASLEKKVEIRTQELAHSNEYLLIEIDERKAIEEALKEKSNELENFFSVALDLLCIADMESNFLKVNQAWSEILGYSTHELQGRKFLDFVHPDDLQTTLDAMQLLSDQNPILDFTNRYRTRNGDYRFIEWHSVPVGNRIYAAARDITKRKRNEMFEKELLQLSTKLTGIPLSEIDNAVNMALERIGRFLNADRSYIFEIDYIQKVYNNTYEWCNEGITAEIDKLQGTPFDVMPFISKHIQRQENIIIPDVAALPLEWHSERDSFEDQNIKSLILIPMIAGNEVNGFVGLDSVNSYREYDQNEINILKVWSSMLASLINDKKTESLLEQTRQNYETFFNTIDDFLFVFNENGFIVDTNNTVSERLGYEREELKNHNVLMVRPEEHHAEALRTIDMMLNGELGVCTLPLVSKTGEQIPVETRVKRGFWNGQEVIFGVSKDISQIKLSEQKFSTAFQSNAAGMAISYFEGGEYIDINNSFVDLLGYERSDVIGKTGDDLNIFVDNSVRRKILDDLQKGIPVRKLEIELRSKAEVIKTGLVSCDSIYIGNDRCLLAVIVDITERKKAEEALKVARVEADKANMAKSEFLSRMSHELRTPMNSILGFAQLLEMGDLNTKQKGGVQHIIRSGKHLLDLINEVLDISRIESGRLSISLEPVKIDYLVQEIIDITNPMANAREIKINISQQENHNLFIRADRQRLNQVLINLISNAIKYNREKGSVTIKTILNIGHDKLNPKLRIEVRDTGLGISDTDIPKLFIPFERIGAEKTLTEGTGLGLAVVKKLMDAMGGAIGVESVVGEGSVFWIELPQVSSPTENAIQNGSLNTEEKLSESISGVILYVEDNVSNIELIEEVLYSQRNRIKLETVLKGNEAFDKALECMPDLILLDLNLPDIHGSEVLEILQADDRTKKIPVVIVSADAMPNQLMKLLKSGARNYLTKPLDVKSFLRIVDQFLCNG